MKINKTSVEFVTRPILKIELEQLEERIDDKNKKYRDQVLTGIDGVMKELETIREEKAAGILQEERLSEKLEDHEERITKLESPVQ